MKAKVMIGIIVALLWLTNCLALPFYPYEFRHVSSIRFNTDANTWIFADLKNNGYDYLIKVTPQMQGSAINVMNQQGKHVSQINIATGQVRLLKVLSNPQDRSRWLIYCINDGNRLYLGATRYIWQTPLQREDRIFEIYPRNDNLMNVPAYTWAGLMDPFLLEDIDADGRLELMVRAIDGYSANPRGLMAFDFDSGALKWFVQTPTCFRNLIFDDFDNDGFKEFIAGTISLNNTELSFTGMDDKNTYIAVIDRFGKIVLTEQYMAGLSEIYLQSRDFDQDGRKEIFAVLLKRGSDTSSNGLMRLSFDGKRLIREQELNLPVNLESLDYPEFMFRLDSSSAHHILINNRAKGLQLYDETLNLVQTGIMGVNTLFAVDDFRQDGSSELLVRDNEDQLLLLDKSLSPIASLINPYPGKGRMVIQLLRSSPDEPPVVVVSCPSAISFYDVSHIPLIVYLYRIIDAYAVWLSLILLAIIIRVMIALRHRDKALIIATNKCSTGFILLNSRSRILFANKTAINLALQVNPNRSLKHLSNAFPELYEALQQFRLSHVDYEDLMHELMGHQYLIHLERLPGLRKRVIITLSPPPDNTDSATLIWAETARRLSHHVRRHITNVILALDPLDEQLPENQQEYLQIMRSEIEKIRVFTHAFQRFTEMHDYELKLIDLVPHLEHALSQIKIPASINLIKDYNLKSMNAYIEPIRFEEALVNTLNNATEAMPEGGTLHISIRIFARHRSPKGNLSVLVEIADSGKGIPAKYMQDIWKPFFTTNQSGTGIGIPETKKILDSMGGILDIQSEEGVGTTVSLWLKGEFDV